MTSDKRSTRRRIARQNQTPSRTGTPVDQRSAGVYIDDSHVQTRDIVGRDQIRNIRNIILNVPLAAWWVSIGTALISVVAVALVVHFQFRPAEEGPLNGLFNVAIDEFGQIDDQIQAISADFGGVHSNKQKQVIPWQDGKNLSQSVFESVNRELNALPALQGKVQVRHKNIGLVHGATTEERQRSAKNIADKVGADLVIYGNAEKREDTPVFVLEFYIKEGALLGAEELTGPNQLGAPIPTSISANPLASRRQLDPALDGRSKAMVFFTIGLADLVTKNYDKAVSSFEQAKDLEAVTAGSEVLYLFLGTAYKERAKPHDISRAREAYDMARQLNPDYARAYIGLSNTYYQEYNDSGGKDTAKLDQALVEYEKAGTAKIKLLTAYVDAKVHISLGNVYVVKAQSLENGAEWFLKAQNEYQQVIMKHDGNNKDAKSLDAKAYFGLGVIEERWTQDYNRAADYYRKSIADAEDDTKLRETAGVRLKEIESLLSQSKPQHT